MKKLVLVLLIGVFFMTGCNPAKYYDQIQEVFACANSINVYVEANIKTYNKNEEDFELIANQFNQIIAFSRQMPAFGVSLNAEIKTALNNGVWVEFVFEQTLACQDMPFDALLINVNAEHTGFNIIRKYNGKYDGRCFYLDLVECDMSALYNLLAK